MRIVLNERYAYDSCLLPHTSLLHASHHQRWPPTELFTTLCDINI